MKQAKRSVFAPYAGHLGTTAHDVTDVVALLGLVDCLTEGSGALGGLERSAPHCIVRAAAIISSHFAVTL